MVYGRGEKREERGWERERREKGGRIEEGELGRVKTCDVMFIPYDGQ
jgi:hypothetical protein